MTTTKRVGILISGRGSNMAALIAAASEPDFPAGIVCVVSNRADANGLKLAEQHGIPTRVVPHRDFAGREAHEKAIDAALAEFGVEIVCLAGYLRLFTESFVERWKGRMINIHPALLPSFKGLDTHAQALAAGVAIHGCTVHFVTAETDSGPIIAQAAVPVLHGDDEEALAARVLKAEHRLYPMALALLARGKVALRNGKAAFRPMPEADPGAVLVSPAFDPRHAEAEDIEHLARFTP